MKRTFRFLQSFVDRRTGSVYHYFRRPGYPRVRLPGLPGSRDFLEAYQAALEQPQTSIGAAKRSIPDSVSLAIARYYDSTRYFGSLSPGTRKNRRSILERFRERHGNRPIAQLPSKFINLTLDRMTPHQARNWLKAIRHLMQFAIAAELCSVDPTQGIRITLPKSDGYYTWTEADVATFEAAHAIGTKPRLAMTLALYTAQRRSDIIRMGPQHIRNGILRVRQDKTGVTLNIPVHPDLQRIIDATPCGHLTFLTTRTGKPYHGNDFGGMFRRWCDAAGLPSACSVHGLRKAACRRLAEAGCSANEIAAISGHATLGEVARYTKAADQARLARNAMARQTERSGNIECQNPAQFDNSPPEKPVKSA
jgi:integrase